MYYFDLHRMKSLVQTINLANKELSEMKDNIFNEISPYKIGEKVNVCGDKLIGLHCKITGYDFFINEYNHFTFTIKGKVPDFYPGIVEWNQDADEKLSDAINEWFKKQ